ncbi:signal peptide peptidase SppA, 36K type [Bartonella bacilliformis str. Heidi Mejia]|uniref:S49 family peptidase n=1 Tax=Bartonella bacilliformis TaxID=774 RepID=UPI00044B6860|nr:S49 family peptidase [Bartonella bacilliformis]EYS92325.1 signal peptide peptidase SppA, 36K type [Bartonella bacilliformis str. Heidi Mejia]KEG18604.1 signal peptide peptidase SppA, 36K type [Bartonella bacilliformis Hosp800-02]KEG23712.1 signal peptide peptidase SppA, 36K type [Bartonella bacilliformis VAB9028]KEG24061.1 signal peptide peptidase SppA, 36K type [Bartonella bacilliformis CAR600-02]
MIGCTKCFIPRYFRSSAFNIPVVRLHGAIMDSTSLMARTLSLSRCADLLDKAFSDKRAPAVALVINSPGGSPVQSRLIFQRIRDLADEKKKQVLVFVEDVAASGGYMIACAGDEIFADATSIVGSIGVVSASFGFPELLKKIGVERRIYTAGKNKVILDPFQPEKKTGIDHLKSLQLEVHQTFIDLVKERRESKLSDDPDIFTGMFWTGKRGIGLGLIDGLGDVRSVVKERFGDKTKLRLISPSKSLLGPKTPSGISADVVNMAVDSVLTVAEERALWQRYGL